MNAGLFIAIIEGIKAVFGFLNIVFSKKQELEQQQTKENNDLKEAMHQALLSGDNTAIVLCLNRYNELRSQKKSGN